MNALAGVIARGHRSGSDPYNSYVVAMLHFDGANNGTVFTDATGKAWTGAGNAKTSTSTPLYGSASLALDGAASWVQRASGPELLLGTNDFTIEIALKTTQTKEQYAIDFYTTSQLGWQFGTKAGKCVWTVALGGGSILTGTKSVNDGLPHNIAIVRKGGVLSLYVDGVFDTSINDTRNYNYQTTFLAVGAQVSTRNAVYDFIGNIDEVRITNGVARYSGAAASQSMPFVYP